MPNPKAVALAIVGCLAMLATVGHAEAGEDHPAVFDAVVRVAAEVPSDARTAEFLGTERTGSGVVIDDSGLVVTIGYLILEAMSATVTDHTGREIPAQIVAYDYDTGFGLLRAIRPLDVRPVRLGDSDAIGPSEPALAVSYGGEDAALPAYVTSRGAFAGYWEYLLESAIFITPPHPAWAGAALIDRTGRLVGIGSLVVADAAPDRPSAGGVPGNVFVPIDLLKPILGDLLTEGRTSGPPRPWLGVFTRDTGDGVLVVDVVPEGPAEGAGLAEGDVVTGVAGEAVVSMPQFFRAVWAQGEAGAEIPLEVARDGKRMTILVPSADRYDYLRLDPSY